MKLDKRPLPNQGVIGRELDQAAREGGRCGGEEGLKRPVVGGIRQARHARDSQEVLVIQGEEEKGEGEGAGDGRDFEEVGGGTQQGGMATEITCLKPHSDIISCCCFTPHG